MDARGLPAAVLAAATDRRGGALEVAATALDGLLEVADDPPLLEAVAVSSGRPARHGPDLAPGPGARDPDPAAALAGLRRRLGADADAAVAAATAWLRERLAGTAGGVATVSHSSLVDRVLAAAGPAVPAG